MDLLELASVDFQPVASEASKRTRVEGNQAAEVDPHEITQSHSQNISSKAISQALMSSTGNEWSRRNSLVNRDLGGRDFDELVLCTSLGAFLDNPELGNRFAKFTAKVKGLYLAPLKKIPTTPFWLKIVADSLHFCTCQQRPLQLHRWQAGWYWIG
jgi:hypothetical protein